MNQGNPSAWSESSHLYPKPALLNRSNRDLRQLIADRLPGALAMVDGFDSVTDVSIECARDSIEQARDILIERGEFFTDKEKQRMDFLRWPIAHSK